MLQSLTPWLLVLLVTPAAYPLARGLLAHSPLREGALLTWAVALALGVGLLSQIMLWWGLTGIPFDGLGIALVYGVSALVLGWALRPKRVESAPVAPPFGRPFVVPVVLIAAAILFNAAYWPFTRDDVVALYHPFGAAMAETRQLIPLTGADSLYRAYPMAIPMVYAFTYLNAGWPNEYAARLLPALLSVATLIPTALIAWRWGGALAAGVSTFVLAVTPFFGAWASSGYVDLPMAFYYALAVLFCLRVWERGAGVDAVLAGVCVGLAAWTKNVGLLGVPLLGIVFGAALLRRKLTLRAALAAALACALVGAPWYLRNLIGAGFVIPDTVWADQAQPTLANLLPFTLMSGNFGLPGLIVTGGMAASLWRILRRIPAPDLIVNLWLWALLALWWVFASYDPRFLLLVLPLGCALGGAWLAALWTAMPPQTQRLLQPLLGLLALGMVAAALFVSVEYKDDLLRDPLMGHEAKMSIVDDRRLGD